MKNKPNISRGVILSVGIYIFIFFYCFLGFFDEKNRNIYNYFIYGIVFSPFIIALFFFPFYSFFYNWARIWLIIVVSCIILLLLQYLFPDFPLWDS